MPDVIAALGIPQLKRLEQNLHIRRRYWKMMNQGLKDVAGVILPPDEQPGTVHARHIYAILLELEKLKISRNQFIDALKAENIGAGIHFDSVHLHKFYRETFGFKKGDYPKAEYIGERTVSLPFYPHMSESDVADVIKAVRKIVEYYKK